MRTRMLSRVSSYIGCLMALSALTACLDLPIEGTLAGESMGWVSTSITVDQMVVAPAEGVAEPGPGLSRQVLLSDFLTSCDTVDRLATPADGLHTLALTLIPSDGGEIKAGVYRVGEATYADAGSSTATFILGKAGSAERQEALSGVLVVSDVEGPAISGEIHLTFARGKLSGTFFSNTCSDQASQGEPVEGE